MAHEATSDIPVAESVAIPKSYSPRRVERPAKRAVPDPVARNESIHSPVGIPIPTRSIPGRPSAYENVPGRLHARFRFIFGAQIAPGIKRILSGLRLGVEASRFPIAVERQFLAFLQFLIAVVLLHGGLAIENLDQ